MRLTSKYLLITFNRRGKVRERMGGGGGGKEREREQRRGERVGIEGERQRTKKNPTHTRC